MYYSAYWLPASLSFAIVPLVPNIPLAYNAFRLYSNFKGTAIISTLHQVVQCILNLTQIFTAYKGAQHLQYLTSHDCLKFEKSSDLDQILNDVRLSSSKELILPSTITAPFSATEPTAAQTKPKPNLQPLHDDIMGVIDIGTLNRIAHELKIPGLEIELKRARFQILAKIVNDRAVKNTLGQLPVEWRNEFELEKNEKKID